MDLSARRAAGLESCPTCKICYKYCVMQRRQFVRTAASAGLAAVPAAAAAPRAGRRKGSGKRSKQALRLVRKQPGITIPELAAEMKINSNYLYRVLPGLEREGKIRKEGRGWYPVEG